MKNSDNSLSENLIKDCSRIGYSAMSSWMKENEVEMSAADNFLDAIALTIADGKLSVEQLNTAIAELDENSDKKIFLMRLMNLPELAGKKEILKELFIKHRIAPSDKKWVNGLVTSNQPTFIYLFWDEDIIKLKYSEIQYDIEMDIENDKIVRTAKRVNVIYLIDPKDGFVQVRCDSAKMLHQHKNDAGKATDSSFEQYYKNLLAELFPTLVFQDMNLNRLANHIANNELSKFRITKGVTTITNNAKQTFATSSTQADIRNLPEYAGAAATGSETWLSEDLVGYWVSKESEGALKKDLFMRIYRKYSQIRVQRGCLAKELDYGISKIREIQNSI
ncbi:hypothetical protein [Mucilaginibacter sp. UR6-11]|uniref:hypothetical protein n=1 Tax=Mucilaginibacter sp. UR6-11 TaxID=1435644 RepID=UPI001E3F8911|nr:hypothetical protein [Mucilaginibacter sp. UR6-11]MCC8425791.1 hypothetical protein [Mucilaginibacter sp. UR6-11]